MDAMFESLVKVLLACAVLYAGWYLWSTWQERTASQDWPSTTGTLIESNVRLDNPQDAEPDGRFESGPRARYAIDVRYRYTVNGQDFTGTRIEIHRRYYDSEAEAQTALADLRSRTTLVVYFDPADPSRSTLVR